MEDLSYSLRSSLAKRFPKGGQVEIRTLDRYPLCLISFLATLHPYILHRKGGRGMVLVRKCKNVGAGVCIQGTIWTVS
jgi:hypothetical protein